MKKTFTILVTALAINAFAQTPNYVSTNGLQGWWSFTGNANDASVNANNGTVSGATLTADRFGNANCAYNFNGATNSIMLQAGSNIQGNNPRSISFWFKATNSTPYTNVIYKGGSNGNGNDFSILYRVDANNKYQLFLRRYTDDVHTDSIPLVLNQWNHYCVVYDGTINSNLKIYINGIEHIGRELAGTGLTFNTASVTPEFGHLKDQLNVDYYLTGNLDDIGIWNRVLTPQEVSDLYNANICYQLVTVTDTLIINTSITGFNPITYQNTIKIYPNPTNDQITINYGNYSAMNGYTLKITNSLGQIMYTTPINQAQTTVNLSTWTGNGIYFVNIIDATGNIIDVKKIILQ